MKENRHAAGLLVCSKAGIAILATIPAIDLQSATNPVTGIFHEDAPVSSTETSRPEKLPPSVSERRVPQERKRVWNSAERFASTPLNHAASPPVPARDTLVLPKITVTAEKEKPSRPPQLHFAPSVKDLPAPDFESPTGRSARLVQKHFTPFEQKLSRVMNIGKQALESSARDKEAIESAALELNRIANVLETSVPVEQEDAQTQKKIHDEFLRAYYQRPR